MTLTSTLRAAKKFGPGYFIREQMEHRDWTQEDLSEITGLSLKHINKILQDKQPLSLDVAQLLGEIFGTSAQYWMNLDNAYRLWLAEERSPKEVDVNIKGMIYERMPVKDMLTKGWLKPFHSVEELKNQVLLFWELNELDFTTLDKKLIPILTRKSEAYNQFNASYTLTWYQKALLEAKTYIVPEYNGKRLENLYDQIHIYSFKKDGIASFIEELAQAGVIFFVLPHLQKTYLDGAAFLLEKNPVIVYTGRYKRIDNFWFTVAHEIAHVLLHLSAELPFVLDNFKNGDINDIEKEANELAAVKLKHHEILEFLEPSQHYLTTLNIDDCAETLKVHPAIIIGKLAHEKKISYKHQNLYNENVVELIPTQYLIG